MCLGVVWLVACAVWCVWCSTRLWGQTGTSGDPRGWDDPGAPGDGRPFSVVKPPEKSAGAAIIWRNKQAGQCLVPPWGCCDMGQVSVKPATVQLATRNSSSHTACNHTCQSKTCINVSVSLVQYRLNTAKDPSSCLHCATGKPPKLLEIISYCNGRLMYSKRLMRHSLGAPAGLLLCRSVSVGQRLR